MLVDGGLEDMVGEKTGREDEGGSVIVGRIGRVVTRAPSGMVTFKVVTTNSRGESFGRNVNAKVVMGDGLRLRIAATPRLESNTAEIVVWLFVMVILARALDVVRDVRKYKPEPRN